MKRWILLFLLPVVACGIDKDLYQKDMQNLKHQVEACETSKAEVVQKRQTLEQQNKDLSKQLQDVLSEKGKLSSSLQQSLAKVQELQEMARKRQAAIDAMKASLKKLMDAGKLKIRTFRGMLVIEMGEKILFDVGKSKLTTEGKLALTELTPILAAMKNRNFQVAGHTDNTGSPDFNWRLSLDRAINVVFFMIGEGMPPDRISAAGYGQYAPIESNDTPEGRAANRRIDIILVPNIEELMQVEHFGTDNPDNP